MDVAITGSHGLIGTALVGALEQRGDRMVPVVRPDSAGAGAAGDGAVPWDPEGGTIDAAGLEGLDAVVHLAGEGIGERRWTDEQKRRIRDSRVKGTSLLASTLAGLSRPPSVLVSASAIGYYGQRGDEVLTEDSPPGHGFLADVAREWEGAAAAAEKAGIRVVHPRTGIVLSREAGALQRMVPLFRFGLGGRMGSGRQWWSWITIDDEIQALLRLLDSDLSGPVNLTAPNPVTNAEFTRALGRVLRRPTLLPVPAFGPKLLLGRELGEELLFSSQRVVPTRLEACGHSFLHPTLEEGLRGVLAD